MATPDKPKRKAATCPHLEHIAMDTTQPNAGKLTHFQEQHLRGLRLIVRQNARIIELMEAKQTGRPRAFLKTIGSVFCEKLSTSIGQWLAGLPLWLLALKGLGLDRLLADWFGFSM